MNDTLEFTIPDGYELDKEKSNVGKLVYRKKDKYVPKEGDLVVFTCIDLAETDFIALWKCNHNNTPCVFKSVMICHEWSFLSDSTCVFGHEIRPATAEEAALFTRIMAENGYEYDPVKKEVRKKRWRAERGKPYLYVSECGTVYEDREFNTWFDCFRHKSGNYFRLSEKDEAERVAAKFKEILNNRM